MLRRWTKITPEKKTPDILVYQLEPANSIAGFILMIFAALFFLIFAIQHDMVLHLRHYLLFVLVAVSISLLITKKKVLEVNRTDRTINTFSQVFFFKKKRTLPIAGFDSIKISSRAEAIEDGYLDTVYSLVLSGSTGSLEIVSVDDMAEAKRQLDELATFLNLHAGNKDMVC
jgi:hypothetical protein